MIHSILIFTLSGIPLYQKHFTSHDHHYQSPSAPPTPNSSQSQLAPPNQPTNASQPAAPKVPPISMLQALISSMWRTAWNLKILSNDTQQSDSSTDKNDHSMLTHMHFDYMSLTMKVHLSQELMCVIMHDNAPLSYEFCYLMAGEILGEFVRVCGEVVEKEERIEEDDEDEEDEMLMSASGRDRGASVPQERSEEALAPEISVSLGEEAMEVPQQSNTTSSTHPSDQARTTSIKSITSDQQRLMNTRFFKICHSMRDRLIRDTLREQHGCLACHLIDVREHQSEFSLNMSPDEFTGHASVSLAGAAGFSAFGGSPSFSISPQNKFHATSSFGTSDSSDSDSFDLSANLNILISHAKDVMHEVIDDPVEIHIKTSDDHIHYIAKISTHNFLVVRYLANRSQHMRKVLGETVTLLRKIHGFMSSISTQNAG